MTGKAMTGHNYIELKALMVNKQYPYKNTTATVRYIDKVNCKKGYCNVMLMVAVTMGMVTPKSFTITVEQLSKIYYGELTFDDLK